MVQLTPWLEENGTLALLRGATIWSMSKVEFSLYVSGMGRKMADLSLQRMVFDSLSPVTKSPFKTLATKDVQLHQR